MDLYLLQERRQLGGPFEGKKLDELTTGRRDGRFSSCQLADAPDERIEWAVRDRPCCEECRVELFEKKRGRDGLLVRCF